VSGRELGIIGLKMDLLYSYGGDTVNLKLSRYGKFKIRSFYDAFHGPMVGRFLRRIFGGQSYQQK
jgi:hypothetical protein